jgi:hypothetical protein
LLALLIKFLVKKSGIEQELQNGGEEDIERLEKIKELATLALKYDNLEYINCSLTKIMDFSNLQISLKEINCDDNSHFELLFAKTLSEKYVSYCLLESVCEHIGINKSSYDLNNSER